MKLENLVPPLELCKQIPEGEFAGSALVHAVVFCKSCSLSANNVVVPCSVVEDSDRHRYICPAPTLAEILNELPAPTCYRLGVHDWRVNLCNCPASDAVCSRNPATAALRLWLKVEGIE